jgi:peptidyl-prolyl cis-trans isomerase B (cyclophilin B)
VSKKSYDKRIARKREQERMRRQRARRMKTIRVWTSAGIALVAVVVAVIFGLKGGSDQNANPSASGSPTASASPTPAGTPCAGPTPPKAAPKTYKSFPATVIKSDKKYVITMVTSCGTLKMKLDPKLAPKAVNNFVFLAREKFYNGLTFHRIEQNAPFQLVQGGDPAGNGTGGPGYQFVIEKPTASENSEYVKKTADGRTLYLKGVIAMANSGGEASNGSQFFIDAVDVELPPNYTVLGKTIDAASLAVLQKMIKVPVNQTSPVPPVHIINVIVQEVAA